MDEFTKFPNTIIEAMLSRRLTALQMKIIIYIVRKTNGWNKPFDYLAISRIARDIGATRPRVSGAVNDLVKMGILSVEKNAGKILSEMSVNAPEKWDESVPYGEHVPHLEHVPQKEHKGVPCREQGCAAEGTLRCAAEGTHKRKQSKDTITKEKERKGFAPTFSDDDDDDGMTPEEYMRRKEAGEFDNI